MASIWILFSISVLKVLVGLVISGDISRRPSFFLLNTLHLSRLTGTVTKFAIAVVGDTEKDVVFYRKDRDTGNSKFKQFNWKNMNESS